MATDISPVLWLTLVEHVVYMTYAQWGVVGAILTSAIITGYFSLKNIRLTRKAAERQIDLDSHKILSDSLRTTVEFRKEIGHLMNGIDGTADRDGLARVITYLEVMALGWEKGLINDDYAGVVYGGLLERLTDEKISKILGVSMEDLTHPESRLCSGLRAMRDKLLA